MTVFNMRGQPLKLRDLSKPYPLPRAHCIFRRAREGGYYPVNDAAYQWRNLLTDGLYVSAVRLELSKNFITVEIENE